MASFDELFNLQSIGSIPRFEEYIAERLKRSSDPEIAIRELDDTLALLQNHIQLLSLYLKQRYLLNAFKHLPATEERYYTKQELANKYRVSIRTVTNWIIDGLEAEEIGGIKRISHEELQHFKNSAKGKKFNWRSIKRRDIA